MCKRFDAFLIIATVLSCHFNLLLGGRTKTLKEVTSSRGTFSIQRRGMSISSQRKLIIISLHLLPLSFILLFLVHPAFNWAEVRWQRRSAIYIDNFGQGNIMHIFPIKCIRGQFQVIDHNNKQHWTKFSYFGHFFIGKAPLGLGIINLPVVYVL